MPELKWKGHETTGMLITFCGLDGCGKTTMIRMLDDWLREQGEEPFLTKQPTDFIRETRIFRTYMDEPNHDAYDYRSLSLLAAGDRVQHSSKVIYPQLQQGRWIVSDRYFYSCVANLRARGYREDQWIYEISEAIVRPDLSFFLDLPVEAAVRRVRERPEEQSRYIDMELQYRLREEYLQLARDNGGIILPSLLSGEQTFEIVKAYVERCRKEKQKGEKDGR